ncbi:5-methyltetrahydropteroyltriglutamate--homocysteine S-methyltransferase [Pleomorphovibrio marinus]|uniref:5-methyltetrahydropteroyltriglutamate-- homocysteine S-methyltransferase n=1 Tax=Pleomorphovibrio marinus TaxID=2164132 RepID=UPI000E0A4297|nr:5-methyltetrahydropteroyltriglutamate--homocysteine S-methyltransferase [Pleomorphovibrio marinus]
MLTHNLGYPRIGSQRELKKACEQFWAGKIPTEELEKVSNSLKANNWEVQKAAGLDLIPVNDFSYYDQVLDLSMLVGAIPERFQKLASEKSPLDLYFAMARGYQKEGFDLKPLEMTKWFETNYHYLVPEFKEDQTFTLQGHKPFEEFTAAKKSGVSPKPVLLGPISYLLLGKEKEAGFSRIDLLDQLLPTYTAILKKFRELGAEWVQIDEPCLSLDLSDQVEEKYQQVYDHFNAELPELKVILANYFDCFGDNLDRALRLPVEVLHLDLVRCPSQLDDILSHQSLANQTLSLGLVDGRNIWKNRYRKSLSMIETTIQQIGKERVWLAPSCSLLHCPYDLDDEQRLDPEIKGWLAFAKQKIGELKDLKMIALTPYATNSRQKLQENDEYINSRASSTKIHNQKVKAAIWALKEEDYKRSSAFSTRQKIQKERFILPLYPTTTIGSFPQTKELRLLRSRFKKGEISQAAYTGKIEKAIAEALKWQEEIGLDVLVHGEFERNDMVEYFGELLNGFAFTQNGWVQSYGSRCVKPPIIYGDVSRPNDMTVKWSKFAQDHSAKPVKGMLTGPITILQWSFIRDDQPRSQTANQIALSIREEVKSLEKAGIRIIQIDEPAFREGLPLRQKDWANYLDWAVKAFRLSSSGIQDQTQIHTHMCYSEFNDIITHIANMDADVITIETSRSEMELLAAFQDFKYPNEIGPGVYDIHSPRIPKQKEIIDLIAKAKSFIPKENIWINPDCGLKTRQWEETKAALSNMVEAARLLRKLDS